MTEEQKSILDSLSDEQLSVALKERERRIREQPSPFPWRQEGSYVVDGDGERIADCTFNMSLRAIPNARILSCGPDGTTLARMLFAGTTNYELQRAATALLTKAGCLK